MSTNLALVLIGVATLATICIISLADRRRDSGEAKKVGDTVWIDSKPFFITNMTYTAEGEMTVTLLDKASYRRRFGG